MKTISLLMLCLAACSCAPQHPALRLIYIDRNNNRVDDNGNLVPWTSW